MQDQNTPPSSAAKPSLSLSLHLTQPDVMDALGVTARALAGLRTKKDGPAYFKEKRHTTTYSGKHQGVTVTIYPADMLRDWVASCRPHLLARLDAWLAAARTSTTEV